MNPLMLCLVCVRMYNRNNFDTLRPFGSSCCDQLVIWDTTVITIYLYPFLCWYTTSNFSCSQPFNQCLKHTPRMTGMWGWLLLGTNHREISRHMYEMWFINWKRIKILNFLPELQDRETADIEGSCSHLNKHVFCSR